MGYLGLFFASDEIYSGLVETKVVSLVTDGIIHETML